MGKKDLVLPDTFPTSSFLVAQTIITCEYSYYYDFANMAQLELVKQCPGTPPSFLYNLFLFLELNCDLDFFHLPSCAPIYH